MSITVPARAAFAAVAFAAACLAHTPLLPMPQEVAYGQGSLPLRGLSIRFAFAPDAEDRFTASELSKALAVPVETGGLDPAIRLHRTGSADPLPGPDDRTGPDSRESYSLEVTTGGVDIRAKSSAGLFYGTRTLIQLVEAGVLPVARVRDWPAMPYRGFMMDLSHGGLLTEDEIKRQIDFYRGGRRTSTTSIPKQT